MSFRIFSIPFDPENGCFNDQEFNDFITNKRIIRIDTGFFVSDGRPYWSVFVEYANVMDVIDNASVDGQGDLTDAENLLLARLKDWRKERAEIDGIPVFIIATNRLLLQIIKQLPASKEALKNISGFGKKKTDRYGHEIIEIVKKFKGYTSENTATEKGHEPQPGELF